MLLRVLTAGVNNTDINMRVGWSAADVTGGTEAAGAAQASAPEQKADGGWNAATPFPLTQGTDCCGRAVAVGPDTPDGILGARVLVRACMRPAGFDNMDSVWMASDFDGAFAEYVKLPLAEVFPNLVAYIERGEIRPLLAATYPLERIVAAQQAFMQKRHVGNIVLIPPGATEGNRP